MAIGKFLGIDYLRVRGRCQHGRWIVVTFRALTVGRRRHASSALMLPVTAAAGNPGWRRGMMKIVSQMTAKARRIDGRKSMVLGTRRAETRPGALVADRRRNQPSGRSAIRGDMTGGASLLLGVDPGHVRERGPVVIGGNLARTDEIPRKGIAEHRQQHNRARNGDPKTPQAALASQAARGLTRWYGAAADALGRRAGFTMSSLTGGTIANPPLAAGLLGFLQRRATFTRGATVPLGRRTARTGPPFAGPATDPRGVRSIVLIGVEIRGFKSVSHRRIRFTLPYLIDAHASGKSIHQHDVGKGPDQQTPSEGNVDKQPEPQRPLERVLIIEAVLLLH